MRVISNSFVFESLIFNIDILHMDPNTLGSAELVEYYVKFAQAVEDAISSLGITSEVGRKNLRKLNSKLELNTEIKIIQLDLTDQDEIKQFRSVKTTDQLDTLVSAKNEGSDVSSIDLGNPTPVETVETIEPSTLFSEAMTIGLNNMKNWRNNLLTTDKNIELVGINNLTKSYTVLSNSIFSKEIKYTGDSYLNAGVISRNGNIKFDSYKNIYVKRKQHRNPSSIADKGYLEFEIYSNLECTEIVGSLPNQNLRIFYLPFKRNNSEVGNYKLHIQITTGEETHFNSLTHEQSGETVLSNHGGLTYLGGQYLVNPKDTVEGKSLTFKLVYSKDIIKTEYKKYKAYGVKTDTVSYNLYGTMTNSKYKINLKKGETNQILASFNLISKENGEQANMVGSSLKEITLKTITTEDNTGIEKVGANITVIKRSNTQNGGGIDGYLKGAIVELIDTRTNKILETTITDDNGDYKFKMNRKIFPNICTLKMRGGIDITTNKEYVGTLKNISSKIINIKGVTNITPITTVITNIIEKLFRQGQLNITNLNKTKQIYLSKLGITVEDSEKDFIKERNSKLMKMCIEIEVIKNVLSNALSRNYRKVTKENVNMAICNCLFSCKSTFKFNNKVNISSIISSINNNKRLGLSKLFQSNCVDLICYINNEIENIDKKGFKYDMIKAVQYNVAASNIITDNKDELVDESNELVKKILSHRKKIKIGMIDPTIDLDRIKLLQSKISSSDLGKYTVINLRNL